MVKYLYVLASFHKCKGKVYPKTGHEGPEGEQLYVIWYIC